MQSGCNLSTMFVYKYFRAGKGLELFAWTVCIIPFSKCTLYYTSPVLGAEGSTLKTFLYISLTGMF